MLLFELPSFLLLTVHDGAGSPFADTMDFIDIPCCLAARWCGALIVNQPSVNPVAHDWNKVLVHYCDGGSFLGDNDTVTMTTYNGSVVPLYFRGRRNIDAVLDSLLAEQNLNEATHVIVGGA